MNVRCFIIGIVPIIAIMCCPYAFSRKMKLNLVPAAADTITPMVEGSITVCAGDALGSVEYDVSQVRITGFDKKADNQKESFFITNTTDRTLTDIDFTINYFTTGNKQLHSRKVELECSVPPGETRKYDIKSFDTQKSFYYHRSQAPVRKQATPFKITIQINCLRLK